MVETYLDRYCKVIKGSQAGSMGFLHLLLDAVDARLL